jgi:Protein of unknown function (DUF3300)
MKLILWRGCSALLSVVLVAPHAFPQAPVPATTMPGPASGATDQAPSGYSAEQLDALLAPIALYPDQLLAQVLMAATYPLQIVDASRWLAGGDNKALTGDALAKALEPKTWDPSVKSIVPFPQVLAIMNQNLDWTQQLGYAASTQQNDVMSSVQRLRMQAKQAGGLQTTEQQVVTTSPPSSGAAQPVIVIEPANPQVVYVPMYNPSQVYGTWPYPSTPPVYLPPPPGYAIGSALVTGMAFAAGAAVVGSLWGWARPSWGPGYGYGGGYGGGINVNTNRYNNITVNNVNRGNFNNNGHWTAPAQGPGRIPNRPPPNGPVGRPNRGSGVPANAIGRQSVSVPGGAVNRPNIGQRPGGGVGNVPAGGIGAGGPGNRPNIGNGQGPGAGNRPIVPQGGNNRPNIGQNGSAGSRPGPGPTVDRPKPGQPGGANNRPNIGQGGGNRPNVGHAPAINRPAPRPSGGGAFGGMQDGARAGQFQQRGAQSRNINARPSGGGGGGGGGAHGGGGFHGGGGRHR